MLFQKHIFKKILSFCDDRLEVSQKRKYNEVTLEFLDLVEMHNLLIHYLVRHM